MLVFNPLLTLISNSSLSSLKATDGKYRHLLHSMKLLLLFIYILISKVLYSARFKYFVKVLRSFYIEQGTADRARNKGGFTG